MVDILFLNLPSHKEGIMTVYPPVGILTMGAMLKLNDYKVEFIDADVQRLLPEEVISKIGKVNPSVLGITLNISHVKLFDEYVNLIQNTFPNIKIVIGGPYVTSKPETIFEDFPNIKYGVFGEGEYAIIDFMKFINGKIELNEVQNLLINQNGTTIRNSYQRIEDLNLLPLPDYSLVEGIIDLYQGPSPSIASPSISIMCTRGCPFNCTFCSSPYTWDRKVTYRSTDSIIQEIKYLKNKINVKEIFFQDDTFNVNLKWYNELLDKIIEEDLNKDIYYKAPFRVNEKILTKDVLKKAREANFWMIFYGVENGNQNMLKNMNKNIYLYEILRAFQLTRKHGICSYASFMIGNMEETKDTVQDSINLMKVIKPDYGGFAIAAPFPGTSLYKYAFDKKLITDTNFKNYTFGDSILKTEKLEINEIEELENIATGEFTKWQQSSEYINQFEKFEFSDMLIQKNLTKEKIKVKVNVLEYKHNVNINERFLIKLDIENNSEERLSSLHPFPIHISYHWKDKETNEYIIFDGIRTALNPPLLQNDTNRYKANIKAPEQKGNYILELTMVQEGQFWFEDIIDNLPLSLDIKVED